PRAAGPAPPEIPWEEAEPAVARILREHYQAVRDDPRSGHAWGRLGMVLLANGYGPQAYTRLVQAEPLDPPEPTWPHLQALRVLAFEDNDLKASLDHLSRAARNPTARRRAYAQLAAVYRRLKDQASADQFSRRLRELPADQPLPDPVVDQLSRLERTRQSQFRQPEQLGHERRFDEQAKLMRDLAGEFPDARSHEL